MENIDEFNFSKIKIIFDTLEQKSDLFFYIQEHNLKLKNNYIVYKYKDNNYIKIEIRNYKGESKFIINIDTNKKLITSYYYKNFIGLMEKIYVDKIEYYINEEFYSYSIDNKLVEIMQFITKSIFIDKICADLYNFIVSDESIILISKQNIHKLNIFNNTFYSFR